MTTTTAWIELQRTAELISGVATIDSGETATLTIPSHGRSVVRLQFPSSFTGTTVTFTVQSLPTTSKDGTTYTVPFATLRDSSGNTVTYTVGTSRVILVPELSGAFAFTIVSGSAEGGARQIYVECVGGEPSTPSYRYVSLVSGGSSTALFPAPAALADTTANPTLTAIQAYPMLYTTPTWDRLKTFGADNQAPGGLMPGLAGYFNNTGWDRVRNNVAGTLLASAARTTTTSSADQTNYNGQAVVATVNITAVPGGDTITVTVEAKDPISGTYTTMLSSAALVATGTTRLRVGTNITAVANLAAADAVGRTWRVTVTPSAGTSFTYSISYDVMTA